MVMTVRISLIKDFVEVFIFTASSSACFRCSSASASALASSSAAAFLASFLSFFICLLPTSAPTPAPIAVPIPGTIDPTAAPAAAPAAPFFSTGMFSEYIYGLFWCWVFYGLVIWLIFNSTSTPRYEWSCLICHQYPNVILLCYSFLHNFILSGDKWFIYSITNCMFLTQMIVQQCQRTHLFLSSQWNFPLGTHSSIPYEHI